jgi:predicted  nucleic acid-binding Zn-ribbon protein
MNVPELALHHQRLDQRAAQLRAQIERLRTELASDPVAEGLERQRAEAEAERHEVGLRMREREREVEGQRSRLRGRERELMSGRIRNPTELMQMNQEVEHMKASFAEEEEAELHLMEEAELAEATVREAAERVDEARTRSAADEPSLRQELDSAQAELASVKADSETLWAQVAAAAQNAYLRVRAHPPVAEVDHNQCLSCRVTVTSSGMQVLRKGDDIVHCDNCGRILVLA